MYLLNLTAFSLQQLKLNSKFIFHNFLKFTNKIVSKRNWIFTSWSFTLHKNMKFSIKDFLSKYDQIRWFPADLVTFT